MPKAKTETKQTETAKTTKEGTSQKQSPYVGKGIAGYTIQSVEDVAIQGKEYKKVSLSNGTVSVLSETDLKNQIEAEENRLAKK